jgi:hypothetical protein
MMCIVVRPRGGSVVILDVYTLLALTLEFLLLCGRLADLGVPVWKIRSLYVRF